MSYFIEYEGELFISDKNTPIQAIAEFKKFREKTTVKPILFFNITVEKVD